MIIIVTGCPGTGKTTIAKKIARQKKLNNFLIKMIKKEKNLVLDSHLSHYIQSKYVDKCIVTKCDLKELKKRLKKRKYSKEKIRTNLHCEIFDVCHIEALENKHNVKVIKT